MNDVTKLPDGTIVLSKTLSRFVNEVREEFFAALDRSSDRGHELGLPLDAICTAIAIEAVRTQALALVAGNIPPEAFENYLPQHVERVRAKHGDSIKILRRAN
jgi:hypothetical protein